MWGFFILMLASLIFWTLYQMAPMGLTLFILNNVDRKIFNFTVPVQWINNINTINPNNVNTPIFIPCAMDDSGSP